MEQAGEIAVQFILVLAVLSFFMCGLLVAIGRIFMQRLTAQWVGRGLGLAIAITLAASISWVYYVDIQSYSGPLSTDDAFPKLLGRYLANVADIMTPSPWGKTPDSIEDTSAENNSSARPRDFRVPENALHILTALGGGLGAFLSQLLFRHKTSKQSFRTFFYFTLIVNAPVLYCLWQLQTMWSTGV